MTTGPAADRTRRADGELYDRAVATLVASWAHFATGSPGARVVALPEASVAVFVQGGALDLAPPDFPALLRVNGVPAGLLPELGEGAHVHLARVDGEVAAAVLAFDHDGDCGIYNVATLPSRAAAGSAPR